VSASSVTHILAAVDLKPFSWRGALRRRVVTSEWNVEGGRQHVDVAGISLGYCWTLD